MHNKKMFELENEGQGHGVQQSNGTIQWQISFSIKVILEHFWLALIIFQIHFKIYDLQSIGQSHDVQHWQWRHMMANT